MTKPQVPLLELVSSAGLGDAQVVPASGPAAPSAIVRDVVSSSDEVAPGALFACIKGQRADGHDFAGRAVERGAVALLCERPLAVPVAQVVVPSARKALGPVSARFWSYPSSAMKVVGVTGTNGKTTTCALLAAVFEAEGWRPGVIGTLTGTRTTPEAPALQRQLAEMRDVGTLAVAMEVSSHALDQHRADGTRFAAAVFTNLSQDHLDYHRTMEAYFEAKARLFSEHEVGVAVVNISGPWGAKLAERLRSARAHVETFSAADATEVVLGVRSTSFSWRGKHLLLNMTGRFNVENAVAAATTARALGVSWEALGSGLAAVAQVRGRFEPIALGQPFEVLVDYAHTPAALAAALRASRERARGKVIVVFGAGGDRDRDKRPAMGQVASELSDVALMTSDNPRSEDPVKIIEELLSGAKGPAEILVDPDRRNAITAAVAMAREGDVVLVAGKGHETGQDFGAAGVEPFDDFEVAREALAAAGYGEAGYGEAGYGEAGYGVASPWTGAALRQSQSGAHRERGRL